MVAMTSAVAAAVGSSQHTDYDSGWESELERIVQIESEGRLLIR